ncbi:hypothetical protein WDV85_02545 [Pseudokineococcus sp. 5B2Z-1]|uniref:hypothetical protein n=1 Tax=Pseudokineococcus sp. 5B2Z-1 TaxID=3132744 RepID=UPI0030A01B47
MTTTTSPTRPAPRREHRAARLLAALGAPALLAATLLGATPASAATGGSLTPAPGTSTASSWSTATGGAGTRFTVPALDSRGPVWVGLEVPASGSTPAYRGRVKIKSDGTMQLSTSKVVSGRETVVQGPVVPGAARAGSAVRLEVRPRTSGSAGLDLRAWVDGSALPSWQQQYVDSGSTAAKVTSARLWTYLASSAPSRITVAHQGVTSGSTGAASPTTPTSPTITTAATTTALVVAPGQGVCSAYSPVAGGAKTSFTVPALGANAPLWVSLEVPGATSTTAYRGRVRVSSDGQVQLSTAKVVDGREAVTYGPTLPTRTAAGGRVHLEVRPRATGSAGLDVRSWLDGQAVPTTWQQTYTDTSAAAVPVAKARLAAYLSGSATTGVSLAHTGVTSSAVAVAAPAPVPAAPVEPGPTTTGVPAGTVLKPHYGDIVVTTPGTRIDGLDVHGFITVKAPDVTITRTRVRGGVATGNRGLITNTTATATNLVVEDVTLVPDFPSVWLDGLKGANFTARRVNSWGTVDNVKVHGDKVRVLDSWLHDSAYFASDPNQGGGPTHNDAVQVLGGTDVVIRGNSLSGASNGAIQVTQDYAATRGLVIEGNWFAGGTCNIKLAHKSKLPYLETVVVRGNQFRAGSTSIADCPLLATNSTTLVQSANVYTGTATPIRVRIYG